MRPRLTLFTSLLAAAALLVSACTDDIDGTYAKGQKAFIRIDDLTGLPALRAALQSPGLFCTLRLEGARYAVTDAQGKQQYKNLTAAEQNYGRVECIAGFIVGTPAIPDMNGQFIAVAYELACPNCWEEASIQRSLAFAEPTSAQCSRCHRTYDLDNLGAVTAGASGKRLYRYPLYYNGQGLVVRN